MTATVYELSRGARLPRHLDWQAIGERLAGLRESLGQGFRPAAVVEDARDPSSPIHVAFGDLWDLSAEDALTHVLEDHAAYIVRHVRVVTVRIDRGEEVREQRPAFVSVIERTSERRRYLPIARAMTDAEYREQTMEEAYRYFWAGRERFKDLRDMADMAPIFEAIDTAVARRRVVKDAHATQSVAA